MVSLVAESNGWYEEINWIANNVLMAMKILGNKIFKALFRKLLSLSQLFENGSRIRMEKTALFCFGFDAM